MQGEITQESMAQFKTILIKPDRVIACKKNKIDCGSFYLYQQDPATSG